MVLPIQSQWLKLGTEGKIGCFNCEKNRCSPLPVWKKKKKMSINLFLGIYQKAADLKK